MLAALPLALVFLWMVLANLNQVTANDLFIHLRVGRDILATHTVPHVDRYSAMATGRPFIAHEWLSAVWFALLDRAWGGTGVSIITALCALAVAVLMVRSVTGRERGGALTIPTLLLCAFVVAYPVEARPHLFSLVILAAFVVALEAWRREGGWRTVWWLVPLQLLWVNLHGGFVLGPVLVACLLACAAALAAFPRLQRQREPRVYGWRDVRALGGLLLALTLVCLLNPYDARIFGFAVEMWSQNAYIKEAIYEWQSPFAPVNYGKYWFLATCCLLLVLWLALIVRARRAPIADYVLALVVTVMAVRALRFVAYPAIVGFPILCRAFAGVKLTRRPIVESAVLALLIVHTSLFGYAISPRVHRPVGVGYSGRMPWAEVRYLAGRSDLRGAVYNEYADGALILDELAPRIKPVIDSRIDIYGQGLLNEYLQSQVSPETFHAYLDRYRCNLVLLSFGMHAPVFEALAHDPDWKLALRTRSRFLFERARPL